MRDPYLTGELGYNQPLDVDGLSTSYFDVLNASYESQKLRGVTSLAMYSDAFGMLREQFPNEKPMPFEETKKKVLESGYDIKIPRAGLTRGMFNAIIQRRKKLDFYDSVINRGKTGSSFLNFGGALAATFTDPIEVGIGIAFEPLFTARMATRLATTTGFGARAALRAKMGAVEGIAGQLALEPGMHYFSDYVGDEYTMMDTLMNVGVGAVMGAGLSVGMGGIRDFAKIQSGGVPGRLDYGELDPQWRDKAKAMRPIVEAIKDFVPVEMKQRYKQLLDVVSDENIKSDEFLFASSEFTNIAKTISADRVKAFRDTLPDDISGVNADGTISSVLFDPQLRELMYPKLDKLTKEVLDTLPEDFKPKDIAPIFADSTPEDIAEFSKEFQTGKNLDNVIESSQKENPEIINQVSKAYQAYKEGAELSPMTPFERVKALTPEQRYDVFNYGYQLIKDGSDFDLSPVFDFVEGKINQTEYMSRVKNIPDTPEAKAIDREIGSKVEKGEYEEMNSDTAQRDIDKIMNDLSRYSGVKPEPKAEPKPEAKPEPKKKAKPKETKAEQIRKELESVEPPKTKEEMEAAYSAFKDEYADYIGKLSKYMDSTVRLSEGGEFKGQYDPAKNLIEVFEKAFKAGEFNQTLVHEVWHSLARFLPAEDMRAMNREFQAQRNKFYLSNPHLKDILTKNQYVDGSRGLIGKEAKAFKKKYRVKDLADVRIDRNGNIVLRYTPKNYRYTSLDEFFAETMKDEFFRLDDLRLDRAKGVWDFVNRVFKNGIRFFMKHFGKDETARVFDNYLRGSYEKTQLRTSLGRGAELKMDTDSPEFKNWFGDSKVVDEDGKPLVVYHGSPRKFEAFKEGSAIGLGDGIYFSTLKEDTLDFGENLYEVYLSLQNPLVLSDIPEMGLKRNKPNEEIIKSTKVYQDGLGKMDWDTEEVIEEGKWYDYYDFLEVDSEDPGPMNAIARELGYDGIIAGPGGNIEGVEILAFEPTQIKSVDNIGTFDPNDPNILRMATEAPDELNEPDLSTPEGVQEKIAQIEEEIKTELDFSDAVRAIKEDPFNRGMVRTKLLDEFRTLKAVDIDEVFNFLDQRLEVARNKDSTINPADIINESLDELAEGIRTTALIKKRGELFNLKYRLEGKNRIDQYPIEDIYEAFVSLLTGSYKKDLEGNNVFGGMVSVKSSQRSESGRILGSLVTYLRKNELMDLFDDKTISKDLFSVMWRRANGLEVQPGEFSDELIMIADKVAELQEFSRTRANEKGAWINKLDGRVVGQTYDMDRVRKNIEAFRALLLEGWDFERSFDRQLNPEEISDIVDQTVRNIASGIHHKDADAMPALFVLPGVGKKLSHSRKIHWKSEEFAYKAMSEYGIADNVQQAIFGELDRMGRSIGTMSILGPSHRHNLAMMAKQKRIELANESPVIYGKTIDSLSPIERAEGRVFQILNFLDGTDNIPVDHVVAQAGSIIRNLTTLSSFGSVVLSQLGDIPVAASEARSSFGMNFVQSYWTGISGILNMFRGGKMREIAEDLGIVSEALTGRVLAKYEADEPGVMTKAMNTYFKYNLMQNWTDAQRVAYGLAFTREFARQSGKRFDQLDSNFKNLLKEYGIDSADWDIARQKGIESTEMGDMLSVTKLEAEAFEVGEKFREVLLDRVYTAAIEPDARTRSKFLAGRRGDWGRELTASLMQFKTYSSAIFNQVYRRNLDRGQRGLMVETFALASLFGVASYQLKEISKGKEPVDMEKFPGKVLLAGAVKGGGLGIFGDFIFGEYNRFGGGFASTIAGPSIGKIGSGVELFQKARAGEADAADFLRFSLGSSAFIGAGIGSAFGGAKGATAGALSAAMMNLMYVRPVLNHLAVHKLQDMASPGYFERIRNRMMKEKGQDWLVDPLYFYR